MPTTSTVSFSSRVLPLEHFPLETTVSVANLLLSGSGIDDGKHDVFATGLILITSAKLEKLWDETTKQTVHADFISSMRGDDKDSKLAQNGVFRDLTEHGLTIPSGLTPRLGVYGPRNAGGCSELVNPARVYEAMYRALSQMSGRIASVGVTQWDAQNADIVAGLKAQLPTLVATLENDEALKAAFAKDGTEESQYIVPPAPIGS